MKLFQTKLKAIPLSWQQLLLANSILQSNMPYLRYPSTEQKTLFEKIQRAKNAAKPGGSYTCFVSEAERKAMRDFNLNYCCCLVDNIQIKVKRGLSVTDGLEAYMLATAIQMKFKG